MDYIYDLVGKIKQVAASDRRVLSKWARRAMIPESSLLAESRIESFRHGLYQAPDAPAGSGEELKKRVAKT